MQRTEERGRLTDRVSAFPRKALRVEIYSSSALLNVYAKMSLLVPLCKKRNLLKYGFFHYWAVLIHPESSYIQRK